MRSDGRPYGSVAWANNVFTGLPADALRVNTLKWTKASIAAGNAKFCVLLDKRYTMQDVTGSSDPLVWVAAFDPSYKCCSVGGSWHAHMQGSLLIDASEPLWLPRPHLHVLVSCTRYSTRCYMHACRM